MNNLNEDSREYIMLEKIHRGLYGYLNVKRNQPKKLALLNTIITAAIFAGQQSNNKAISYSRNSSGCYKAKSLISIINFLSHKGLIINHTKGRGRNMLVPDVNTVNWFKATSKLLEMFDNVSVCSLEQSTSDATVTPVSEYAQNLYHLSDFDNTKMINL